VNLHHFNLARQLSYKSDHDSHHLGCVITYKNRVIGKGYNRNKTHPISHGLYNNSIHAEMDALRSIRIPPKGRRIAYIVRERKDGTLGMARPCEACMSHFKANNVYRIFYSTYNGFEEELI
jgi:deoxycytidylate deaminase